MGLVMSQPIDATLRRASPIGISGILALHVLFPSDNRRIVEPYDNVIVAPVATEFKRRHRSSKMVG
jgi:hypothetical protein